MTINKDDIKVYVSQRLTDEDDAGGRATGNLVVDGEVNNLFRDISQIDRTVGDVSMRKVCVGVVLFDIDSPAIALRIQVSDSSRGDNQAADGRCKPVMTERIASVLLVRQWCIPSSPLALWRVSSFPFFLHCFQLFNNALIDVFLLRVLFALYLCDFKGPSARRPLEEGVSPSSSQQFDYLLVAILSGSIKYSGTALVVLKIWIGVKVPRSACGQNFRLFLWVLSFLRRSVRACRCLHDRLVEKLSMGNWAGHRRFLVKRDFLL